MPILEPLELPEKTYLELKHIAGIQGVTPLRLIEGWVQEYKNIESLQQLRQEYQELIDEDLKGHLTKAGQARLDIVCNHLNEIEMQSKFTQSWERTASRIDEHFEDLMNTLSALPNRKHADQK